MVTKEERATAFGVVMAFASALISVYRYEGVMLAVFLFAMVFGVIAVRRCSSDTALLISSASLLSLIVTLLSVTVLEPDNFLVDGDPPIYWFVLVGLVHAFPVALLTFAVYSIFSAVYGASYNWVLVRGFSPFIAMGMEVPGFVFEYMFKGVDDWMTDNGYILYHFLMTLIVVALLAYWVSVRMRAESKVVAHGGLEGFQ